MRVLRATTATNGDVAGDYTAGVPGELVYLGLVCASDRNDPDGGCGCGRGFSGLSSARATTTAVVADVPLSEAEVREAYRSGLARQGWISSRMSQSEVDEFLDEVVGVVTHIAEHFRPGTVLGRRLDSVVSRGFSLRDAVA
jgi:hypothetical protein